MTSNIAALFTAARDACATGGSTLDFEPAFARLLDAIKAAPECRDDVAGWLAEIIRTGRAEWELLSYLMYELRWPEVKQAAEERLRNDRDPRSQAVVSHILDAFGDDWGAVDMYRRWAATGRSS